MSKKPKEQIKNEYLIQYSNAMASGDKNFKKLIYNRLIEAYNADTSNNLKKLSSCGSCIRDFEQYNETH